jgi:hypothetical protein
MNDTRNDQDHDSPERTSPGCPLCVREDVAVIKRAMVEERLSVRKTAERFEVKRWQVEAHRVCLGLKGGELKGQSPATPEPAPASERRVAPAALASHVLGPQGHGRENDPFKDGPLPPALRKLQVEGGDGAEASRRGPSNATGTAAAPEGAREGRTWLSGEPGAALEKWPRSGSQDPIAERRSRVLVRAHARLRDEIIKDAKEIKDFDERVSFMADVLSMGVPLKRTQLAELAEVWELSRATIHTMFRRAHMLLHGYRTDRDIRFLESVMDLEELEAKAIEAEDFGAAVRARAELNKLWGFAPGVNAAVQVNIGNEQAFKEIWQVVALALRDHDPSGESVRVARQALMDAREKLAASGGAGSTVALAIDTTGEDVPDVA